MAVVVVAFMAIAGSAAAPVARARGRPAPMDGNFQRRKFLYSGLMPMLLMRPLASLAVGEYLPPGMESDEFKRLDARATEFKRQQLAYKSKWNSSVQELLGARTDAELLAAFKNLREVFNGTGNGFLPEGVSRDDFLRQCRRKEREMENKGLWQKPVRMEFLDLKMAIDKSQRPKGMGDSPSFG